MYSMGKRNFAIIGHRAISSGKLPLNDISGIGGRMDVLLRAVNSALFISHGIRDDVSITLHLMGGPGPARRIKFEGNDLRGLHSDERAISGLVAKVLREPVPPIGMFADLGRGILHSGGDISNTITEWRKLGNSIMMLNANSPSLENYIENEYEGQNISFILSDDNDFTVEEYEIMKDIDSYSLGSIWLQGHSAITIVHHMIDEKYHSSELT